MRDAGAIRMAALAEGILCLTSIDTALAAAAALDPQIADDLADVRPLGWVLAGKKEPRVQKTQVGSLSGRKGPTPPIISPRRRPSPPLPV